MLKNYNVRSSSAIKGHQISTMVTQGKQRLIKFSTKLDDMEFGMWEYNAYTNVSKRFEMALKVTKGH